MAPGCARILDSAACVHLHGKGRKQRTVPLWHSIAKETKAWLKLNPLLGAASALLPNRQGEAMTRDNVTKRLALAVATAVKTTPTLEKRQLSPHTGATPLPCIYFNPLWLGHESPTTTHQYVEADLVMKEKALARLQDPDVPARRFKATESLLEFLKSL